MVDLLNKFIQQCLIIDDALAKGRVRANNKAMKALIKIHKAFEQNVDQAACVLTELLKHENDCVRSGAAAHCLALGIQLEQAKTVLQDVAIKAKNKVVAFNAQATLDVYKKQGYLKMYPEKEHK